MIGRLGSSGRPGKLLPGTAAVAGQPGTVPSQGVIAALLVGAAVAGWRLRRGHRPRSVLIGLLAVCLAAAIALRTGRASDFFLVQLVANGASALAFAVSIVVRWPLLGVVVGIALGQRGRWRRDPALLRAYGRASWVWVAQYAIRVAVFVPLYYADQVVALVAARVALTWPLVAASVALSWWIIRRSLPPDIPACATRSSRRRPVRTRRLTLNRMSTESTPYGCCGPRGKRFRGALLSSR